MIPIAELQDRLRRLAKRREAEGNYTDAVLCAKAAERLAGTQSRALEKLAALAERQKSYHCAKQHEFPSIEQCVDEDGVFRPDRNLYELLQGEAANGRYSEADWWLCTIRAEISALAEPAGWESVTEDDGAEYLNPPKGWLAKEVACGWRSCTGCHETNEGYETGRYSYSTMFGCHVGHGCSECGGLGVVWEYWSKDTLDDMARDVATPPDASAIREALADDLVGRIVDDAIIRCRALPGCAARPAWETAIEAAIRAALAGAKP